MVVDIKTVLICDAVDGACIELLEANGIKVSDKVVAAILEFTGNVFTQMFHSRLRLSKNCQKMNYAKKLRYVHDYSE